MSNFNPAVVLANAPCANSAKLGARAAVDIMTDAISDMASMYVLGTPESRAVLTALEHARILVGAV